MDYIVAHLPFGITRLENLNIISKTEAKAFFNWLTAQIPIRLQILSATVRATPGYQHWRDDYSRESIDKLGNWLSDHMETCHYTKSEMEEIYRGQPDWILAGGVREWRLTERAASMCIDTAIYVAEAVRRFVPEVQWVMDKSSKSHVFYQHPMLRGSVGHGVPPLDIVSTLGVQLAERKVGPQRLLGLFDLWMNAFARKRAYVIVWGGRAYVPMPSDRRPDAFWDAKPVLSCSPTADALAATLGLVLRPSEMRMLLQGSVTEVGIEVSDKALGYAKVRKMLVGRATCCSVLWRHDDSILVSFTPYNSINLPMPDELSGLWLPGDSALEILASTILNEVSARERHRPPAYGDRLPQPS